jgi:hypothetical protein
MHRTSKYFFILLFSAFAVTSIAITQCTAAQSTPKSSTQIPTLTSNIAIDYSEVSRTTEGANTKLVLAVDVKYNFGEPVTINFQNFTLNIAVERGGPPPIQPGDFIYTGTAKPIENRSVTIDSNDSEDSFQLTFKFPTLQNNAHGQTFFTNYQLVYSGNTNTASPFPTPTVPEFPTLTVSLFFSVVSAAFVIGAKKQGLLFGRKTMGDS